MALIATVLCLLDQDRRWPPGTPLLAHRSTSRRDDPDRDTSASPGAESPAGSSQALHANEDHNIRRGRYWIASATCGASMRALPTRSAIVRASLRMRWYARALICNCCIAARSSDLPAPSTAQCSRTSAGPTLAPALRSGASAGVSALPPTGTYGTPSWSRESVRAARHARPLPASGSARWAACGTRRSEVSFS
jgi:hypothetical protein